MSAPVLFARARESAAVLARAETLLRAPAGVADVVVEVSLPEHDGRAVLEPSLFFARVGQSRQRLAKYDPAQKRDDDGKWSAFGGIPAFSKEHLFADGTVSAKVDKGGLQLTLANNAGGTAKSGGLDNDTRWKLARRLEIAAEWNPREDGYPAEGDDPEMVTSSVATYPEDDDGNSLPTGFAQVSHDGTGNIELELLDSDAKVKLSRAEAKQLSESVRRSAGVSRVSANDGPLDVFPTDDRKIGLRLNAADGSVVEPVFDGKSWTKVQDALNVVSEGYDEMEDFVKSTGQDADGNDIFPDVDALEVNTSAGRMLVRREGAVTRLDDADYGSETLSFGPVDGSWRVAWPGDYKHPVLAAFGDVGTYAAYEEWPGIRNAAPRLPQAVVWRPLAAGVKLLPRAEFTESQVKRDRKGRFAEKNAAQVLSELDELMGQLAALSKHMSEDERDDFDNAMDHLKGVRDTRKASVDSGGRDTAEVHDITYGEIYLTATEEEVVVEYGGEAMYFTAVEAEEIAGFLDEFVEIGEDGDGDTVAARRTTSSGGVAAVLFGNGMVEIGPSEATPSPDEDHTNLSVDPFGDFADAKAIADALEELAETASQGPVTNTAVTLPHAKFDPNQQRDSQGRWTDGRLDGLDVMDAGDYADQFGDVLDERSVADTALTVRMFESGDAHLALDLPDGKTQVLWGGLDGDGMRDIFYALDEMAQVDVDDDAFHEVVDEAEAGGLTVGRYGSGDYRLGFVGTDDYLDLSEGEADELRRAFETMADSWDADFEERGEPILVSDSALRLPRNHPGKPPHKQSDHGRKKKLPDLSEVEKVAAPEPEPVKKPARKRAVPKAPVKKEPNTEPPKKEKAPAKTPAKPKTEQQLAAEEHVKSITAGLPPAVRKQVQDALFAQAALAPRSVSKLAAVGFNVPGSRGDLGDGFAEYVRGSRAIDLNTRWKSSKAALERSHRASTADGYLAPTGAKSPLGAVVAHEFGHRMAFRFMDPQDRGIKTATADKLLGPLAKALGVSPPRSSGGLYVTYPDIDAWLSANRSKVVKGVSEYGSESIHELFGEVWQEFSTLGDNARPAAKAVGQALLDLAEKGGGA